MNDKNFQKCKTCGQYYPIEETVQDYFCSWACTGIYQRCDNCGGYFLKGKGFTDQLCSQECSLIIQKETKY